MLEFEVRPTEAELLDCAPYGPEDNRRRHEDTEGPGVIVEHERVISSLVVLEDDVSCSVGTATKFGFDHVDVLELIRRADAAMYKAKQQGGGRFESSRRGR